MQLIKVRGKLIRRVSCTKGRVQMPRSSSAHDFEARPAAGFRESMFVATKKCCDDKSDGAIYQEESRRRRCDSQGAGEGKKTRHVPAGRETRREGRLRASAP